MMTDSIADILTTTRRIAVVGASNKPERAGNYVFAFLVARGFDVTGVNPGLAGQTLHGRPVVGTLAEAEPLDMVDVFRASDQAGAVVDEAVRLGARTVWLQLGVVDAAAAERARAAGVRVVMDRCPMQEWGRLNLPLSQSGQLGSLPLSKSGQLGLPLSKSGQLGLPLSKSGQLGLPLKQN